MIVAVGSTNRAKLVCVENAFAAVFGRQDVVVEGWKVESGVPEQPLTEHDAIKGARHRARAALEATDSRVEYGVGLEGGLVSTPLGTMECGWIVVRHRDGRESFASTAHIRVPRPWISRMDQGETLGAITDEHFGTTDCGAQDGYFGLMTNNAVTRTGAYGDAVAFALCAFLHPDLFPALPAPQKPIP